MDKIIPNYKSEIRSFLDYREASKSYVESIAHKVQRELSEMDNKNFPGNLAEWKDLKNQRYRGNQFGDWLAMILLLHKYHCCVINSGHYVYRRFESTPGDSNFLVSVLSKYGLSKTYLGEKIVPLLLGTRQEGTDFNELDQKYKEYAAEWYDFLEYYVFTVVGPLESK